KHDGIRENRLLAVARTAVVGGYACLDDIGSALSGLERSREESRPTGVPRAACGVAPPPAGSDPQSPRVAARAPRCGRALQLRLLHTLSPLGLGATAPVFALRLGVQRVSRNRPRVLPDVSVWAATDHADMG